MLVVTILLSQRPVPIRQGTTVDFRSKEGDIRCSNHDSQFKIDGTVKKGPAVKNLDAYKTSFDAVTKILKVN